LDAASPCMVPFRRRPVADSMAPGGRGRPSRLTGPSRPQRRGPQPRHTARSAGTTVTAPAHPDSDHPRSAIVFSPAAQAAATPADVPRLPLVTVPPRGRPQQPAWPAKRSCRTNAPSCCPAPARARSPDSRAGQDPGWRHGRTRRQLLSPQRQAHRLATPTGKGVVRPRPPRVDQGPHDSGFVIDAAPNAPDHPPARWRVLNGHASGRPRKYGRPTSPADPGVTSERRSLGASALATNVHRVG
jgi:hypothetical protein